MHPLDRPLLAVQWKGDVYVDPMLPFGLRSAPKIFKAVADAFPERRQVCVAGFHASIPKTS